MPQIDGFQMTEQILQIMKTRYGDAERMHIYAVTAMNET